MKTRLALLVVASCALFACGKSEPVCTDAEVVPGCTVKCRRVVKKADQVEFCSQQLVLKADSRNSILASDIKKVQTRKLPKEVCYQLDPQGKISDATTAASLTKACTAQSGPTSAPAKGY